MHKRPNIKGRDISSIRANLNNHSSALVLSSADLRVCKDILGLIFAKFHFLRVSDFAEKKTSTSFISQLLTAMNIKSSQVNFI